MQDKLKVCEVFSSIQGEGTKTGQPSVFIRLLGCNLHCAKCDTKFSWKMKTQLYSPQNLLELLKSYKCRNLVITGGEPLLQRQVLNKFLDLNNELPQPFKTTVETNCTIYDTGTYHLVDLISISPKLKGMGKAVKFSSKVLESYLKFQDKIQIKFVIAGEKDIIDVLNILKKYSFKDVPVILQPNNYGINNPKTYLKKLEDLTKLVEQVEAFKKYDIRVLPQLHFLLWGRRRGV